MTGLFMGPQGKHTTFILLNGHFSKMTSNDGE